MKCPEFSEILDLIDNKLSPESKKRVEEHLKKDGCHKCGELFNWSSQTIQVLKSNQVVEAPEYAVQKAVSLFQERKGGLLDWVRAKLDFDSWALPAMAGVRSEDRGPHQVSYVTENYKVLLMLPTNEERATLTGQLIATNGDVSVEGCLVQVESKNRVIVSRFTNRTGEFILDPVPAKKFDLLIHGDPESIRISL